MGPAVSPDSREDLAAYRAREAAEAEQEAPEGPEVEGAEVRAVSPPASSGPARLPRSRVEARLQAQ